MMFRLEVVGLKGHWDVEIPEDHEFIKWANKQRDESGRKGWDAVAVFERAVRNCIGEDLKVSIIPGKRTADEERRGFVAQAMWDEPERVWFDVGRMMRTSQEAVKLLEESCANFEKRKHEPTCVRKGILATRIIRRTILDSVDHSVEVNKMV
jgi:hypothetical protein